MKIMIAVLLLLFVQGCGEGAVSGTSDKPVGLPSSLGFTDFVCVEGFVYFKQAHSMTPIFDTDRLPKRCKI